MKIVQLTLDEGALLSGIDAIALVEEPAIEEDFYAFSKQSFQSYDDYPQAASDNAARAVRWAERNGWGRCGTGVGKARAHQLAKREPISEETIARMAAFERHRRNSDTPYGEGCGGLMWDAWGGDEGVAWAQRKLQQIREEQSKAFQTDPANIDVYGYLTQHYEICPGAISLFNHLIEMNPDADTKGMIRANAIILDQLFAIEKQVLAKGIATEEDLMRAVIIAADFIDLQKEIDERIDMEHNIDWVQGHIDVIISRIPEGMDADVSGLAPYTDELPEEKKNAFAALKDKQMLVGKLMTPNKLIPRISLEGEPYYAYFSPKTIRDLAYKFIREGYQNSWNYEHIGEHKLDGITLVETWIVDDPENDKANVYGLEPKKGEWIGMVKIEDKAVWKEYVKSGLVKGFSIEGFFADKLFKQKEDFVYPTLGESKDDYIARCVTVQMDEGKDLEQALAICYTTWDNR